jgi:hypothetical protein
MADGNGKAKVEVKVLSIMENGVNAHVALHLCVVETDENGVEKSSAPQTRGVDFASLQSLYGGDVGKWMQHEVDVMIGEYRSRNAVKLDMGSLVGKRFTSTK